MSIGNNPKVGIIVLNFNGIEHLEYSLESISSSNYANKIIYLVDNGSKDKSVKFVAEKYPDVKILTLNKNYGWAGGNNRGISQALKDDCDIVALANNDILVDKRWIDGLIMTLRSNKNILLCGFKIYGESESVPVESWLDASKKTKKVKFEITEDHIGGMLFSIRSDAIEKIGLIDESYFIYSEETDFQYRIKLAGYLKAKCNIPIWHNASGTMKKFPIRAAFYQMRSSIRFAIKHYHFYEAIRTILSIYKFSVFFPLKLDKECVNNYERRLRPRGRLLNLMLLCFSTLFNLIKIPEILYVKRKEMDLIKRNQRT